MRRSTVSDTGRGASLSRSWPVSSGFSLVGTVCQAATYHVPADFEKIQDASLLAQEFYSCAEPRWEFHSQAIATAVCSRWAPGSEQKIEGRLQGGIFCFGPVDPGLIEASNHCTVENAGLWRQVEAKP